MARPEADGPASSPPSQRAAWLVGTGIFLSKISGLVREQALAYFFGPSAVLDAFRAALRVPNVLQNLLGEGSLSASFIPVYAEMLEEGREEDAGHFAGAALGLLTVTAFTAAGIGILLAPVVVPLVFWRFDPAQQALTVRLVRVLFLMTAVLVVSAWALGVLNSHRRFFVSYVSPVLWNVAMVATLLVFGSWSAPWLAGEAVGAGWSEERLVVALAWGAVLGGVLQLLVQLPWVVPVLRHFRFSIDRSVTGVREAIRNLIPVMTARGVVNLSGLADTFLAAALATGALSTLGWAQALYMLPVSLFGITFAASELPELSRRRSQVAEVLVPRVRTALERLAFLLVPSVLAYLTLGDLFVAALFEIGAFGEGARAVTYAILAAYALGLGASTASRALSSAYYAIRDTRTPARIAYLRAGLSVALGAALMIPLDRLTTGPGPDALHFGAVGLALGSAVGAWVEYALLRRALRRAIGAHGPRRGRVPRVVVAGGVAALAGVGGKWFLGSLVPYHEGAMAGLVPPSSWLYAPLLAAGTAGLFGVVYLAATALLGVGAKPGSGRS